MSPSPVSTDRTWQAIEIVCPEQIHLHSHEQQPQHAIARIVYEALWTYDCGPITFLSLPGITRQRILLRGGSPPSTNRSPPRVPSLDSEPATETTTILAGLARQQMPAAVGLSVVNVETLPLGTVSAHTHRLLATPRTTVTRLPTSPPALTAVLEVVQDTPHALSVVAQRGKNQQTELSVRLVEFDPEAQIETRDGFAAARTDPSAATQSLKAIFDDSGYPTITNGELPEEHGWTLKTASQLPPTDGPIFRKEHAVHRNDSHATLAMTLARSDWEYAEMFKRAPSDPLADYYNPLGLSSRLAVDSESLAGFYPVQAHFYEKSVWTALEGRTTARITPVSAIQVPKNMNIADTDPTTTGTRHTTSVDDGDTDTQTPFGRAVQRWCLQRGETLQQTEDTISGAPFVRIRPDGTHILAYLINTDGFHPGDLVAASRQAIEQPAYDGLAVFCATDEIAEQAFNTIVYPARTASPTTTGLYRESAFLRSQAEVAVRPRETTTEQWVIRSTTDLQCVIDGDPLAVINYTDPLTALVEQFPRVKKEQGGYTVRYPTEKRPTRFSDNEELLSSYQPISRPARPGKKASLLESTTVLCQDGPTFSETRTLASWDHPQSIHRKRDAGETFLAQYTIQDPESAIPLADGISEFVSYLRYQSDEPISVSLERSLSDHPQSGQIQGRAWRYTPY